MAENNTPVAEPEAVEAVGETPQAPAAQSDSADAPQQQPSASAPSASAPSAEEVQQNNENRGNRDRDRDENSSSDEEDREYRRRGNRDDRPEAGRMQGPTDLLPELDASEQDAEREELPNTRAYEVTYIVIANNEEAQTSTQDRLKEMIETGQGAVDNARVTEPRRLAFPIKKQSVTQTEGVYVVTNARFPQTLIPEMDRFFKLENNVLRHIILREGR